MKILGLVAIALWWALPIPIVINELKDKEYLTAFLVAFGWITINTVWVLDCLGLLP